MHSFSQFKEALERLRSDLDSYSLDAEREVGSVQILPVTKRQPLEAVGFAHRLGLVVVGENVVQEAAVKVQDFRKEMTWELIGHLQSNKARIAVELFDRIQTVDNLKLLCRLDRFASEACKQQRILLQINTSQDPAKYGVPPEDADQLVETALDLENIILEGFMTIGLQSSDPAVAEKTFYSLRELRDRLEEDFKNPFPELSMGMSGDLESAVRAGSTIVRVGTALFGERPPRF